MGLLLQRDDYRRLATFCLLIRIEGAVRQILLPYVFNIFVLRMLWERFIWTVWWNIANMLLWNYFFYLINVIVDIKSLFLFAFLKLIALIWTHGISWRVLSYLFFCDCIFNQLIKSIISSRGRHRIKLYLWRCRHFFLAIFIMLSCILVEKAWTSIIA